MHLNYTNISVQCYVQQGEYSVYYFHAIIANSNIIKCKNKDK